MKIIITINTDNAAFQDPWPQAGTQAEIDQIFAYILKQWETGEPYDLGLRDSNGNVVGKVEVNPNEAPF